MLESEFAAVKAVTEFIQIALQMFFSKTMIGSCNEGFRV